MDQSYSENDVSLSPSKIFERLQMLRKLQIMQRGKLTKHHLQYQDSPEISSSVTEIVSHFSNSTSYNTFRSLLQSSQEVHFEDSSCYKSDVSSPKEIEQDYIEGVSALNLSQESEFITNSPVSSRSVSSKVSTTAKVQSNNVIKTINKYSNSVPNETTSLSSSVKQHISLDDMPILSPKKDFEELIIDKLKAEKNPKSKSPKIIKQNASKFKKPFLKRGEGMARFGLQKNDLVIQNTKTLPWRRTYKPKAKKPHLESECVGKESNKEIKPLDEQIVATQPVVISPVADNEKSNAVNLKLPPTTQGVHQKENIYNVSSSLTEPNNKVVNNKPTFITQGLPIGKHPVKTAKSETWASVLTKEQDMFLRQLKQSDYYKNFVSPAKSTVTDTSHDGTPLKLRQEREKAEQNMFELLENKVTHDSFNINNSFFNRFLRKNNLECSGESTPMVLQRCLNDNPDLLHLNYRECKNRNISCCDGETCSVLTDGSETCSYASTCSCKNGDPSNVSQIHAHYNEKESKEQNMCKKSGRKEEKELKESERCLNDSVKNGDCVNVDMVEMNAKLIATSELLKDRLKELEHEIETFRKENANLSKLREEFDVEKHKFYEEKTIFEQKYNEEKILSEYYLAEEKEKLNKQKQIYERYVRDMRGRLNKKDKEEVINLKREITELKNEIRNKDAKSTATIARLRSQLKIIEKEKKTLQDEIEKLKKENKRIQHSNDITRRLTNLKYLEQINKKLTNMSTKDVYSETEIHNNQKYKSFEIERQSRIKKSQPVSNTRRRAKSVPNLNVTSRYAKYFSKKDSASDKVINTFKDKHLITSIESDTEESNVNEDGNDSEIMNDVDSCEENNLEKIYNERFQSFSLNNDQENLSRDTKSTDSYHNNEEFFIQKPDTNVRSLDGSCKSKSPHQVNPSEATLSTSKSPNPSYTSYGSYRSPRDGEKHSEEKIKTISMQINKHVEYSAKSPVSILTNRISGSHSTAADINRDIFSDKSMIPSPEPSSSRTSVSKTNLNPTEIRKPDGSRELRFPNGNVKYIAADGKYSKFIYYNGDIKENFFDEGRIKYFYAETKTYHTTHADGLEVLEFSDGQVEKRYKDGSSEIRLPNGSVRYYDPKNEHVREEWRFPDGAALTVSASGEQRILFPNGQVEVHAKDHKRREFPDGTVKLVYNDGTSETRYASGRVRIKDKHGILIMDSAPG